MEKDVNRGTTIISLPQQAKHLIPSEPQCLLSTAQRRQKRTINHSMTGSVWIGLTIF
jgi:hypothetical protein